MAAMVARIDQANISAPAGVNFTSGLDRVGDLQQLAGGDVRIGEGPRLDIFVQSCNVVLRSERTARRRAGQNTAWLWITSSASAVAVERRGASPSSP